MGDSAHIGGFAVSSGEAISGMIGGRSRSVVRRIDQEPRARHAAARIIERKQD